MTPTEDQPLTGREVLLCVTGGIACYKSAELARRFVGAGASVSVAMTAAAERFVAALTFQTLSGRQVFTSLWDAAENHDMQHISLTASADLMVVAPATANIIAKMAAGIADDLVSTLALSASGACPILLAPAMNERMWNAPPTRENMDRLKARSVNVVGPAEGALACGVAGVGRMAEPEEILAAAVDILNETPSGDETADE